MISLYSKIKALREEKGWSQQELAEKMGYTSRTTIAKIEAGKVDISQSKIVQFAEVLNTTPAYLMGWDDAKEELYNLGLSTDTIAEELDISPDTINSILQSSDSQNVDVVKKVIKIARLLSDRERTHRLSEIFNNSSAFTPQSNYDGMNSKLRTCRIKLNLSIDKVAEYVDVSVNTITRWENGDFQGLNPYKLNKLANMFKVSTSYLLGWDALDEEFRNVSDIIQKHIDFTKESYGNTSDLTELNKYFLEYKSNYVISSFIRYYLFDPMVRPLCLYYTNADEGTKAAVRKLLDIPEPPAAE